MKPTQQEIIELAREAHHELVTIDYPGHIAPLDPWTKRLCERFAALLLERFGAGAGGGEHYVLSRYKLRGSDAWTDWYTSHGDKPPRYNTKVYEMQENRFVTGANISPADLQAVRDKALEDAANVCDRFQGRDVGMQPAECAGAIRAMKGKQ